MTEALANLHKTLMALDRPRSPTSPPHRSQPHQVLDFYLRHWSPILLCLEFLLDLFFLQHGPLHPIDYPTYLVQARQIRLGERDYAKIQGPTGPLVYPGGHVLIFSVFERLFGIKGDSNWTGYLPAQWIFLVLQLVHTYVRFVECC
jgi:ALG3 protein